MSRGKCRYNDTIREEVGEMHLRIQEILREQGKTKYWLYIRLGLSYGNFNRLINNQTAGIKFENLKCLCDILGCTPNDLFEEYHSPAAPDEKKQDPPSGEQ